MNKLTSPSRSAVFAFAVLGTITTGHAQVTYYNSGSSGTTITNLSVAGDGTGALTRMGMKTELYSGSGLTNVNATIQGVTSEGIFFGTGFDGAYKPIYLDFDGSVKFLSLDPTSSIAQNGGYIMGMEGGFVQTRSNADQIEMFLNGTRIANVNVPGAEYIGRNGITRSGNSVGELVFLNGSRSLNVFSSTGEISAKLSANDGSGILQQGRGTGEIAVSILDLVENDQVLYGWENLTTGVKGTGLYNIASGTQQDISADGIQVVRMNTNGDMLGIVSKPVKLEGFGGGTVESREFWFYKNGEGWFNASEINGMDPVLAPYLLNVNLSEGGVIYGLLDNSIRVDAQASQAFRMAPVPEPGTMLLLAAGAGGFIAARRRKNRS